MKFKIAAEKENACSTFYKIQIQKAIIKATHFELDFPAGTALVI